MIRRSDMTTNSIRPRAALVSAVCALALAGCGGLGDDASIGGTLSGLGTGLNVILALNGAGNLTLTSNGAFTFATRVAAGATYSVTVVTQPLGQTCTVANASGTVSASTTTTSVANITNVSVTCVASASITGTVTGLPTGTAVTLSNGTTTLPIAANGPFAFPGVVAVNTPYAVTVTVQPGQSGQHTCTLTNASGVIPATGVASVTVTCV
jgi:hypothetical protein